MIAGASLPPAREPFLRGRWRRFAPWCLGAFLALDLAVLFFVLSFANVTAEGPAKRGLGHSLAILTEVDAYLDGHYETLFQEAGQTDEPALSLRDFPVALSFTPEEITAHDREAFRALLLTRAAARVYDDGAATLRETPDADVSFFSPQGAVRSGLDFLRARPHRVLGIMTIVLAVVAAGLAAGLVLTSRGYNGLLGLGLSVVAAAVPFLITAVAVRFAFRVAASGVDDEFAHEFLELGQELTWAPIRNGIIFSVGGATVLAAAIALLGWQRGARRP